MFDDNGRINDTAVTSNMAIYPGGKGGSGVYQKIISLMPKHKVYIECFLGNGSILRYKKPANHNIGIEIDKEVCKLWKSYKKLDFHISNRDAVKFLELFSKGLEARVWNNNETLIYCDPPYLKSVRRSNRQIYRCDMMKESEHIKLLEILISLKTNVMISGYDSELYNEMLSDWRKVSFTGVSRAGATVEVVWMNFDEPLELHDYKFLGDDYRQRENIKRKKARWINRLQKMNPQERYAFLSAFEDLKADRPTSKLPMHAGNGKNEVTRSTA